MRKATAEVLIVPLKGLDETAELRAKVRAMRLAFAHLPGMIVGLYDLDGRCLLLEGVPYEQVFASEGQHFEAFLPPERRELFLWLFERAKHGETSRSDYPIGELMFEATVKPVIDERSVIRHVMFYVRDITSERASMAALLAKGGRDSLTGLPRRGVLQAHVDGLLRKAQSFHLLFMDLDGFKAVNDTMGHKTGDVVLEKVARVLQSVMRAGDLAVRLGGDEFVVVLADTTSAREAATRLLARVLEVTDAFGAGASIGIASYPENGRTLDELLSAADRAMYTAKSGGGAAVEKAPESG